MRNYADLLAATIESGPVADRQDARAQLAMLYRELGISAVAAALAEPLASLPDMAEPDTVTTEPRIAA